MKKNSKNFDWNSIFRNFDNSAHSLFGKTQPTLPSRSFRIFPLISCKWQLLVNDCMWHTVCLKAKVSEMLKIHISEKSIFQRFMIWAVRMTICDKNKIIWSYDTLFYNKLSICDLTIVFVQKFHSWRPSGENCIF